VKVRERVQDREFSGCDVFHSTYFSPSPNSLPSVVTVHDMAPERFPEWFWDMEEFVEQKRLSISLADRIIAISQATADDLVAFYPSCQGKINVIHHGGDHLPFQADSVGAFAEGSRPYVLFVGDRVRYKNFRIILEAMMDQSWPANLHLLVAGAPFGNSERLHLERFHLTGRVQHAGKVSDSELADLYQAAVAMMFPSLLEGFGFPILEAQRCRCPVICSDIPVFREVAGTAAVFVDPLDPGAWARNAALMLVGSNRAELVQAGVANESRFRWENCARQTMDLYRDLAESNRGEKRC